MMVTLTGIGRRRQVWPYLSHSGISSSNFTRTIGLFFMGNFNRGSPLVQETTGGIEATVSHTCLSLKILAYPITVIVVAHAWLLCIWKHNTLQISYLYDKNNFLNRRTECIKDISVVHLKHISHRHPSLLLSMSSFGMSRERRSDKGKRWM